MERASIPESFNKDVGKRIKRAREVANVTCEKTAFFAGISTPTLLSWEYAQKNVPLSGIVRIAQTLNMPVHEFISCPTVAPALVSLSYPDTLITEELAHATPDEKKMILQILRGQRLLRGAEA